MATTTTQSVEAEIPYLAVMQEKPLSYSGYPELEKIEIDWRRVPIHNARNSTPQPNLKDHGFAAVEQKSAVENFDLTDDWHETFRAEIIATIKSATGAKEVIVPAISYRKVGMGGSFDAASFAHNDYTSGSTARHIVEIAPDRADDLLSRRFATYNIWKLISPPPQNMPLALCAANSIKVRDMVPAEAHFGDPGNRIIWGEVSTFSYNPEHEWYYYPDLSNDEMLIFCGYDSDPAYASIVPHTAFTDPSCPKDAQHPRTNIDARCYAFF